MDGHLHHAPAQTCSPASEPPTPTPSQQGQCRGELKVKYSTISGADNSTPLFLTGAEMGGRTGTEMGGRTGAETGGRCCTLQAVVARLNAVTATKVRTVMNGVLLIACLSSIVPAQLSQSGNCCTFAWSDKCGVYLPAHHVQMTAPGRFLSVARWSKTIPSLVLFVPLIFLRALKGYSTLREGILVPLKGVL